MINVTLLNALSSIYLVSSLAYCCSFFFRLEKIGRAATAITAAGLFVHTAAYALRWFESYRLGIGHSPFSFFTLYETIAFFFGVEKACLSRYLATPSDSPAPGSLDLGSPGIYGFGPACSGDTGARSR